MKTGEKKTEMTQFVRALIIIYYYYRTTETVADREVDFFFLAVFPPGRMLALKNYKLIVSERDIHISLFCDHVFPSSTEFFNHD